MRLKPHWDEGRASNDEPCANCRAHKLWLIASAAANVALGAVLVWSLVSAPDTADCPPADNADKVETAGPAVVATEPADALLDDFDLGGAGFEIRQLRQHLSKQPCNRNVASKLVDKLLEADHYQAVIAIGRPFLDDCGYLRSVAKDVAYAYGETMQHQESAALYGRYIAEDPDDKNAWHWRADKYAEAGDHRRAALDAAQSVMNGDIARSNGIDVTMLGSSAEKLGEPCWGAFASTYYMRTGGHELNAEATAVRKRRYRVGSCQARHGRGSATFAADRYVRTGRSGQGDIQVAVDPSVGMSVITQTAATRLGLSPDPTWTGEVHTSGRVLSGTMARLPDIAIEGASARDIPVLVTEESLPGGAEAILGFSFLWRFDVTLNQDEVRLRPLPRS